MSDYPLGAKYDKNAPYNEKRRKIQLYVSMTYGKTIEVEVEGEVDRPTLYYLASEAAQKEIKVLEDNNWSEVEFEVIKEEYDEDD